MAAVDHLNHEQLRMFVPAKELKTYNPNPYDYSEGAEQHYHDVTGSGETVEEDPYSMGRFWEQKEEESWESGVYHSVGEEGVRRPVNVFHGQETKHADYDKPIIGHGHHRVSAAVEHDPEQLVPVRHFDDFTRHGFYGAVDYGQ